MRYFDNAATTFPKPKVVLEAITDCMQEYAVNAGRGVYKAALKADTVIASARNKTRRLLGANDGYVLFAPSASIALNQVVSGIPWKYGDVVYTTQYEHNSVSRVIHQARNEYGIVWDTLDFDPKKLTYDLDEIRKQFFLKPPTALILSHVSNVFGFVTPIEEIAEIAKEYGALVIIDGAQAGPLLPMRRGKLVDFYIFSGHKTFYGPFGIAGIWTHGDIKLEPTIFGGTGSHSEMLAMPQEFPYSLEVGSPNVVAIAGLDAACDWISQIGPECILRHERNLNQMFIQQISEMHGVKVWAAMRDEESSGISSFIVDGFTPQELGMILDQTYDCAVRTGLHCSPMAHKTINSLPRGTVRVSFGWFNTEEEVKFLVDALKEVIEL